MKLRKILAPATWQGLAITAGVLLGSTALTPPAKAIEFEYGEVSGSVYTTLSAGATIRAAQRNRRFVSGPLKAFGYIGGNGGDGSLGNEWSPDGDDGNLNFDEGDVVTAPVRGTTELDARWKNLGFYARGTAFYDYIFDNNDLQRNGSKTRPRYLQPNAQDDARMGWEMQDLYVRGEFDIGTQPLNVRIGQQTITWGEAMFSGNAINVINPLDISKLVIPGTELRDGLMPVPMAWASYEIQEGLTVEGFYQWQFRPTRFPPNGTFFGTDFLGEAIDRTTGVAFPNDCGDTMPGNLCFRTRPYNHPGDSGNWGIASRIFSEELNSTEFGLYFIHYTDRNPSISYSNDGRGGLYNYQDYRRNIKLVGGSFNTTIDSIGWSLAGEVSYKMDASGWIYGGDTIGIAAATPGYVYGSVPVDAWTGVLRGLRTIPEGNPFVQALGASGITLIPELSMSYVPTMPDGKNLLAGSTSADQGRATKASTSGIMIVSVAYDDPFGVGVNATPNFVYYHSIQGSSPLLGQWVKGAGGYSVGVNFEYQKAWNASLGYTNKLGSRSWTQNDMDFVSMSVSYVF